MHLLRENAAVCHSAGMRVQRARADRMSPILVMSPRISNLEKKKINVASRALASALELYHSYQTSYLDRRVPLVARSRDVSSSLPS